MSVRRLLLIFGPLAVLGSFPAALTGYLHCVRDFIRHSNQKTLNAAGVTYLWPRRLVAVNSAFRG